MSSRLVAGSSTTAKRKVVQILFGSSPQSRCVDHTQYSFADLKAEYLERLQQLHPDKYQGTDRDQARATFVQLKDAWSLYEEAAKMMKKVKSGSEITANFTMFGVGCSFSDNDQERELRNAYMDQACRGWLPAGVLGTGQEDESRNPCSSGHRTDLTLGNSTSYCASSHRISLTDDSDFIAVDSESIDRRRTTGTSDPLSLLKHLPYYRKCSKK
jgi:hypothetical protein